jgi:TolA-binding protein
MRTLAALAILIALPQESEVVAILKRFHEKRQAAGSAREFRDLCTATRDALDAWSRKAKESDPELPLAAFSAGEMHLYLNEPEEAYKRLEAFVARFPDVKEFSATARFLLGELSIQVGQDARGREKFADFVKKAPADDTRVFGAKILSAMSFVNEGRHDDAIAALEALAKASGATSEGWAAMIQQAFAQHLAERNDEAKATLAAVIKSCTDLETSERTKRLLNDWLAVGKPLADFAAKDVAGADFRRPAGKVTLLYFFTSSFEQAEAEIALMRRFHDGHKDLAVMGVSIDKSKEAVERFVKQNAIPWPVCCDGDGYDGPIASALKVRSLPFVLLIDKAGKIRFMNMIYTPGGREVRPAIAKLLAEK